MMADIFAASPAGRSNIGCLRGGGKTQDERRRDGWQGVEADRELGGVEGGAHPSQEISLDLKAQNRTAD